MQNKNLAEDFRESVGTMEKSGKRKWVFPKKPKGRYTYWRTIVSWGLLAVFVFSPFIKIGGNPFLLFNIMERRFFLLGYPFYPQDLYLLAIVMVTTLVFIILFTVVFGRLFCGWICPQTIFLEHVFRRIEYWIEGDRNKQIRLDQQEWDAEKIRKKGLKWLIYLLISIAVSHLMYCYIVGYERVWEIMKEGISQNYDNFVVMVLFTGVFFMIFSWFREQACTLVCPYGRLQGVLIDQSTINVMYDYKRGEGINGRAKWKKNQDRKAEGIGDCIDCGQCVVVCPTGIDIRNGIQLECVNCTACMDACDEVMEKVHFPKGLVRYTTENLVAEGKPFKFTMRMKSYTMVLVALIFLCSLMLVRRSVLEGKFLRVEGSTYRIVGDNIENPYQFTLINKSNEKEMAIFKLITPDQGEIRLMGRDSKIVLDRNKVIKGTLIISIPKFKLKGTKENIQIGVYNDKGVLLDKFSTVFEGPFVLSF